MKKKKVLSIILIVLLLVIIGLNVRKLIINNKIKSNAKVADKIVEDITKDKEMTIVLEINPKVALLIKDGKVDYYKCLNEDCERLNKDFVGKSIKDAVESIYSDSKEKGFNVENGVKLYSKEIVDLKLSYVVYENLDEEINIKEETKEESKVSIIDELKKDEDYGVYYECEENEGKTSCFIKGDIELGTGVVSETLFFLYTEKLRGISRVLTRFGIKNESVKEMGVFEKPAYYIYINDIKFINLGGETTADTEYIGNYNCSDHRFKLTDLDLLDPGSIKEKYYNNELFDIINNPSDSLQLNEPMCKDNGVCYITGTYNESYCDFEKGYRITSDTWEKRYFKTINGGEMISISKEEFENEFPTQEMINGFVDCDSYYDELNDAIIYRNNTGQRYCKYPLNEQEYVYMEN